MLRQKYLIPKSLLLTSMVIMLSLLTWGPIPISAQTWNDVRCVSITFDQALDGMQLNVSASGVPEPVTVRATVRIANVANANWLSELQLAVDPPDSNWRYIHLPQFESVGNGEWRSVVDIQINEIGSWVYTLETQARAGISHNPFQTIRGTGPSNAGCPPPGQGSPNIPFQVEQNPDQDFGSSPILGSCYDQIEAQRQNRFTCNTTPASNGVVIDSDIYCSSGYTPDVVSCSNLRPDPTGLYCLPCISQAEVDSRGRLGHLEVCSLSASSPPEQRCNESDVQGGVNLRCQSVRHPDDSRAAGTGRCLYVGGVAPGNECYLGTNECSTASPGIACYAYGSTGEPYIGLCAGAPPEGQLECNVTFQNPHDVCRNDNRYGPNAECVSISGGAEGRCVSQCQPGHSSQADESICPRPVLPSPNDPTTPPTTPTEAARDYGIRNCNFPGLSAIGTARWDEYQSCVECVSGVGDISDFARWRRAMDNREATGEFLIPGEGKTWTALGCIDTTPEGIFAFLVRLALGVLGGVVLLRLIYLGYVYQSANEAKIAEAKAGIWSTLGAIFVVVFSVVILQFIGVNLLDVVPVGFFGSN